MTSNGAENMVDARYRNPAWVTNQVMTHNVESSCWSARFTMPTTEAQSGVTSALLDAGASRAFNDEGNAYVVVVEFAPVLVRRMVAIATRSGGVLVEMTREAPQGTNVVSESRIRGGADGSFT